MKHPKPTSKAARQALLTPELEHKQGHSVDEACALLDCSRGFVYELIARGELETVKIGRRRIVPKASIQKILTAQN